MSSLRLDEIGRMVRLRREELGLSQARLALLAGLSRATINHLETGTIVDLGVSKLAQLLDLLGLSLRAEQQTSRSRGLQAVSQTASVSYKQTLMPELLAAALVSGELPAKWMPHVSTMLDEAPAKFIVAAVEETARSHCVPAKLVWRHLLRWARELKSPRSAWA
jgi:transcriptional regulator with XRE-family HTH domain